MTDLFGFQLLVSRPNLRTLVDAVARRADSDGRSSCTLEFPGEPALVVPFEGDSEDGTIERIDIACAEPPTWLNTRLWLPLDARGQTYAVTRRSRIRDERGRAEASIGYVSLFFATGDHYAILHIGAVTSSMSDLFEDSEAIRTEMLTILAEGGGIAALCSRSPGPPWKCVDIPECSLPAGGFDAADAVSVDRIVDEVLRSRTAFLREQRP